MIDVNIEPREAVSFDVEVSDGESISTTDYNKLKNIPTLNGVPIMGDMYERDPTVPEWAKQDQKPTYSASEVNAVCADDGISIEYLAKLFEEDE